MHPPEIALDRADQRSHDLAAVLGDEPDGRVVLRVVQAVGGPFVERSGHEPPLAPERLGDRGVHGAVVGLPLESADRDAVGLVSPS